MKYVYELLKFLLDVDWPANYDRWAILVEDTEGKTRRVETIRWDVDAKALILRVE